MQAAPKARELWTWWNVARHSVAAAVPPLSTLLGNAYERIVVAPLLRLYRHGPAVRGFGFWRGAPDEDVCAALTGVAADFWRQHPSRCAHLIRADLFSYVVFLETLVYFYVFFAFVRSAARCTQRGGERALERRGWLQRYSPVVLVSEWRRRRFDAAERRPTTPGPESLASATADADSPYKAYQS